MLNNTIVKLLNEKLDNEYFRSNLFLDLSGWASDKSLKGVQGYFLTHSRKSLSNVREIMDYLNECGYEAKFNQIPEGIREFDNIEDLFNHVKELEECYKADLNNLLDVCLSAKDFATLATFEAQVKTQHADEFALNSLLDKISIVGSQGHGLYLIDKELQGKYPLPAAPSEA